MLSIFFLKCFSFRYVKQIAGEGFEVDFVNVWRQIFVFARTSFTFLSGAEQISWCRAHGKLCCCAGTETQCHWQIPAASLCKYDTLLTIFSGICTAVQWKPFVQAMWCVSYSAACYISCLLSRLCYKSSSITMTPYSPSVWGGVVLGFVKLYWLPMASSMCSGTRSCPQQCLVFWQQRAL